MLIIPTASWVEMRHEAHDLLDAIEMGGVTAGERWLKSRHLAYRVPGTGNAWEEWHTAVAPEPEPKGFGLDG